MSVTPKKDDDFVTISEIKMTEMRFNIVGTTPLMPHSASAKAKLQLLLPPGRKNAAERASTLKHEPFEEFREATYKYTDGEAGATRLYMPAGSIHSAMKDVAIDMVGAKKAQIGRLTSVPGGTLPLFGIPELRMMMVRQSGMTRAPDIRTLPCLRQWALPNVTIRFVSALINETSIANLLANAGIIMGIGDGRQQKGYFDHGSWRLAADDDEELLQIIVHGGKVAQDAAFAEPKFYDLETEQLMAAFEAERDRRAAGPPTSVPRSRKKIVAPLPTEGNGQPLEVK